MESNFRQCMEFVFAREGGYVDNPKDPGGATNLGITLGTLSKSRGKTVTKQDVRNLGKPEATRIYHASYWLEAWGDLLPSGVDLLVYDLAVNAGPGPSLDMLKRQVGLVIPAGHRHHPAHRKLSDPTMRFVLDRLPHLDTVDVIRGLCERRRAFYRRLTTFPTFGKGWLLRVDQAQHFAEKLWIEHGTNALAG